jgi:hypothetical protein
MIKFAAKLLLFAGIFLIYDKIFFIVADRSAETEVDKRLEYLIKGKINKDIIITGSSGGSRDILAELIEDATCLSTYNLCYPGSNVEFHEFILRTLVKFNEPPKIVLLTVDDDAELLDNKTITFRKDRLYPLVKYPYIRKELINRGDKDKFFSKFLILHQLNKANFDLKKKVFSPLDTIMRCGSMPISWQRKGITWHYIADERVYTADNEVIEKVRAYKEIIKTCKSNNIRLVIVFPPNYQTHSKSFENRIKELTDGQVYYYIYDTENPIYRNKDYFYDESHLMKNGAIVFTNEIIQFLNDLFENEIKIHNL